MLRCAAAAPRVQRPRGRSARSRVRRKNNARHYRARAAQRRGIVCALFAPLHRIVAQRHMSENVISVAMAAA
jgi:hypothetical protein